MPCRVTGTNASKPAWTTISANSSGRRNLARIFAQWLPPQTPNEPDSTEPMDIEPSLSNLKVPPAINVQTLKELEELGGHEFLQTMIQKFVDDALECVTLIEEA